MINIGDDTFDVVNCPTDDLCIFIWISVFPNPSDREIYSDVLLLMMMMTCMARYMREIQI